MKSFAEDYGEFIGKSKRMTNRCEEFVKMLGIETSCEGAGLICEKVGITVSGDTIINLLKKECENREQFYEGCPQITSIGVDDFAYCKGQTYCTIVCDGETRRPIEVLDGRDGKTLKEWLVSNKKHMKVNSVTRDRASVYTEYHLAKKVSDSDFNAISISKIPPFESWNYKISSK